MIESEQGKIVAVILVLTIAVGVGVGGLVLTQSGGPVPGAGAADDGGSDAAAAKTDSGSAASSGADTASAQMVAAAEFVTPERDVAAGETVELGSTDSSVDGDLSYTWTQTGGPAVSLRDGSGPTTAFDAPDVTDATTLTFELTVSNGEETDTSTVTVTVEPTNRAPSADAGDDTSATGGRTVELAGSVSDPDGDEVDVEWRQTAGPDAELTNRTTATATVALPTVAETRTLTFELVTSDGEAATTDTVTLTVDPANRAPDADAGRNLTVREGHSISLNATETVDADGDDLTYSWNQTSGKAVDLHDAATATPWFDAFRTVEDETVTFELTVSDGRANATDTVTVTVEETDAAPEPTNGQPTAATGADRTVDAGATVTLSGSDSTDPDGDDLTYGWTQTVGPEVSLDDADEAVASFAAPDVTDATTLTFELTVADGEGGADVDTVTVTVEPPAETATRDEISKAKYYLYFDELSHESSIHVEEFYLRQPFADGLQPGEVQTRDELAEARHGTTFDDLGRDQALAVQQTFDAQFGDTGDGATYTRDELSHLVFGENFSAVANDSAVQIQELYDRQPFADGVSPESVRTRAAIARDEFDASLSALSTSERLTVERLYAAQFADEEGGS